MKPTDSCGLTTRAVVSITFQLKSSRLSDFSNFCRACMRGITTFLAVFILF
jgi:hypothetical protein